MPTSLLSSHAILSVAHIVGTQIAYVINKLLNTNVSQ